MSAACPQPSATARKFLQLILQRVASVKNHVVAEALGKDESTISRIVSNEAGIRLNDLHPFLDALGLKVVPKGRICVDVEKYNALLVLAKGAMANEQKIDGPQLEWE